VPAVVAAEHGFVAAVALAIVAGELARLDGGVAGPDSAGVSASRIELDGAYDRSRTVGDALALGNRVFVHPRNGITIVIFVI
jgi:hypothetical protein